MRRILCLLILAATASSSAVAAPVIGRSAPALAGKTFNGPILDLSALHGRVVVLNLWATWCAPCRMEMPALDAFYRRFADRGVVVVGLDTDKASALPTAARIASALAYPNLPSAEARADGFGMPQELPATVIIDPEGVVRAITTGADGLLTEDRLLALTQPYLPRRNF